MYVSNCHFCLGLPWPLPMRRTWTSNCRERRVWLNSRRLYRASCSEKYNFPCFFCTVLEFFIHKCFRIENIYLTRSLKIADGIDMKQYVVNEIRCACTSHFCNEHHDLDTQCALLLVHRLKFFVAGLHVSPHRRRHTWRLAAVAFLYWNKEPSEICKCIARVRAT